MHRKSDVPIAADYSRDIWCRLAITDSVWFKDLRALGATDAAKEGKHISEIQTRLAHTSSKTSEIYIKESIPETSKIDLKLPWAVES